MSSPEDAKVHGQLAANWFYFSFLQPLIVVVVDDDDDDDDDDDIRGNDKKSLFQL